MEIQNTNLFIPKCLENELKILQDNDFDYTKTFSCFFNSMNKKSIEDFKKNFFKNKIKDSIPLDSNYTTEFKYQANSIIIPNCSKDMIIKILRNFHLTENYKSSNVIEQSQNKTDEVECWHQQKEKEKGIGKITLDENQKNSIENSDKNFYTKAYSKIFGTRDHSYKNNFMPIFNKITKINNIDYNCDYFNVDFRDDISNQSGFSKLKSGFFSNTKNYDLFSYFYETFINLQDRKKIYELNTNILNNDMETKDIQSNIISQNNDETTDDCILNRRQINSNNFYLSKNAITKQSSFDNNKNSNFSFVFFKFINKSKKQNYFNFNFSFVKESNIEPQDEFVLVISIIEINKLMLKEKIEKNNKLLKSESDIINKSYSENNQSLISKIDLCIFSKKQIDQIEANIKNIEERNRLINEYFAENTKIPLFNDILKNFEILISIKIKKFVNFTKITEEDIDALLTHAFSCENTITNNIINFDSPLTNNITPVINNSDFAKFNLIDINFKNNNEGFKSNKSNFSNKTYIDLEEDSNWISEFNEELNSDFKFENDTEYKAIKRMQELDLKSYGYYEIYLELIKQLKKILKEDPYTIFGENELIRHIYGWRGDLEGCRESLIAMLEWRKETKPELYNFEKDFAIFPHLNFKNLINIIGEDVYGRPVLKFSPSFLNPKILNVDLLTKYLVFILESAISQMRSYLDKFILFVDLSNVGYSNVSTEHLKKINEFTRKYYVERLAKIYIINKGFFFSMLWTIVSKFLDERVHRKLIVVDKSHKDYLQYLLGDNYSKAGINL